MLRVLCLFMTIGLTGQLWAAPLHQAIDTQIAAKANGQKLSALSDDAEFLRRVYLDFTGHIPTVEQTKAFFADKSTDKRAKLIDQLVSSPDYPKRMADVFHIMFMERLGDYAEWSTYLRTAFEKNTPWNQMARAMLRADHNDANAKGASFFMSKRLENYGQNPVDYPALTRDLGRLFLGKNLQCAQCHDHLFIEDYLQKDFQGLFAFVQNAYLVDAKTAQVAEKPATGKVSFMSVFKKQPKEVGLAIPNGKEFQPMVFPKGEEYTVKPDPKTKTPGQLKFSPLTVLAEQLPTKENPDFARNIVNRLWFVLLGRGLVHPLDLHHSGNPPSHPELLELLANEFVAHGYDIQWLLKEIARSQAYQRSSVLPEGVDKAPPEKFTTALEKRLAPEQLMASVLLALNVKADTAIQAKFMKAYANAPREPEEEVAPSLKSALFILNDPLVLSWFTPQAGNLLDRLTKLSDEQLPDEMYLAILSRPASVKERTLVQEYLKKHAAQRPTALSRLAWALFASTEFSVNH